MFDLLVLGWGKAGKTLAKKAASQGKKVAIVERDPAQYGGTCINVGCLPTKFFTHQAKVLNEAQKLGWNPSWSERESIWKKSIANKTDLVKKLNQKNYHLLADLDQVTVYNGVAKFVDSHRVAVQGENGVEEIAAENIVINTGATARRLVFPGCENPQVVYSDQILEVSKLPKKLLIIGSGFIGLEFASYFANYGTEVEVVQFDETWLPSEDEVMAQSVKAGLEKQGIKFSFNTTVTAVAATKGESESDLVVTLQTPAGQTQKEYDLVLVAVGREPNIADLDLAAAGVGTTETGAVAVDEYLRTNVENIWAAGDVKGGPQFTFISLDDSRIIWPQLFAESETRGQTDGEELKSTELAESSWTKTPVGGERKVSSRENFATCTFVDPPYARVGLNEKQAQAAGIKYQVRSLPTAAIPKANVIGETVGLSQILVNDEGVVIGATLHHYQAAEMINLLSLAIKLQVKAKMLGDFIYTHPTFTESLNDILG